MCGPSAKLLLLTEDNHNLFMGQKAFVERLNLFGHLGL